MYVERIKLRDDIFTHILEMAGKDIIFVDDILSCCNKGSRLNKSKVYYSIEDNCMCVKKGLIYTLTDTSYGSDYWKMVLCIPTANMSEVKYTDTPYATTAVKYVKKLLLKYYNEEEYEECLNSHTIDEHVIPLHINPPYYYDINKIYKLTNCVYYDINRAHLDALCEIFPKAKNEFIHISCRIDKLRAEGKYEEAQHLKDLINIYVGELGNNKHPKYKKTNEWIVNRTKNILENTIKWVEGDVIYANTDGVIIKDPKHPIATSNKLGDFKNELKNDIVYLLIHKGDTLYTLFQYNENEKKGTALNAVRDDIDLSKGIYVDYKRTKTLGGWEATDIQIKQGVIYEY